MKNAYVLEDHFGDNGHARPDMVLTDVSEVRFAELERQGLVREATAAEVKEGSKHTIERDPTPAENAGDEKQAEKPENKKAAEPVNKQAPKPATKAN